MAKIETGILVARYLGRRLPDRGARQTDVDAWQQVPNAGVTPWDEASFNKVQTAMRVVNMCHDPRANVRG